MSMCFHLTRESRDFRFVEDVDLKHDVKLAILRQDFDFWFSALKIFITIELSLAGAYAVNVFVMYGQLFPVNPKVAVSYAFVQAFGSLFYIVFFVYDILREILIRMDRYRSHMFEIREHGSREPKIE